jgi:spore germination protein YaaH
VKEHDHLAAQLVLGEGDQLAVQATLVAVQLRVVSDDKWGRRFAHAITVTRAALCFLVVGSFRGRGRRSQAHPLSSSDGRGAGRQVVAVAVVVVVAGLALFGVNPFGLGGAASGPAADPPSAGPGSASPEAQASLAPPVPGHEVYGFLPYWEMDSSITEHVADTNLSTLGLFSVTHRSSGRMQDSQQGYKRITGEIGERLINDAHKRGKRVEIVYTSFGEDKNRAFYADEESQANWIRELVSFTEKQRLDGINVDVEGLPADLVPAYGLFVGKLRTALLERLPDAQLSVSTPAGQRGAAMAAAASVAGADRIFLMGYDYHYPGSQPGASAPMEQLDGEERDLPWSLDRYASLGVPVERTILGLPLYGVLWPVSGPGIGAPSLGRGDTWVPRRNLGVFEDEDFEPEYNAVESVEFYAVPGEEDGTWEAVYYDSPRSLAPKLALANDRGLAGAGFWAIGYTRGLPEYTELINAFAAGELPEVDSGE